jgi:UDP-2,3-diacylglucosamine pyrophosphatase LpxH
VKSPVDIQQFTDIRERARITSLLKGRCDAMFMGHIHRRIFTGRGGVRYITLDDYRSSRSFCRVSVKKDGISWEFGKL